MGEEKEKKELAFRYGVCWKRRDGAPLPHCPACKNLLSYRKEGCDEYGDVLFYTEAFCKTCKKVSPVHDDEGYDITIKDAIGLMKAKFSNRMEDGVQKGESEDRNEILSRINSLQHDVDYLKHRIGAIDAIAPKLNALYDGIEYKDTFILDKLNKILRILGEKKE